MMANQRQQHLHQLHARAMGPLASELALLTPRALVQVGRTSRAWRDAAGSVGVPLHVYAISTAEVNRGSSDEMYGAFYQATGSDAAPPFETNRGLSGGILELSLIPRCVLEDKDCHQIDQYYPAVTVSCSCPAIVDSIGPIVAALRAAGASHFDPRPNRVSFSANRFPVRNPLRCLPRAVDMIPMAVITKIARLIMSHRPTVGLDWASSLLGVCNPCPYQTGPPKLTPFSELADHLRVTRLTFSAPNQIPGYDEVFYEQLALSRDFKVYDGADVLDCIGSDAITLRPSLDEKKRLVHSLSLLHKNLRQSLFRMFMMDLPRLRGMSWSESHALWEGSEFTLSLLDEMRTPALNVLRIMARRYSDN